MTLTSRATTDTFYSLPVLGPQVGRGEPSDAERVGRGSGRRHGVPQPGRRPALTSQRAFHFHAIPPALHSSEQTCRREHNPSASI